MYVSLEQRVVIDLGHLRTSFERTPKGRMCQLRVTVHRTGTAEEGVRVGDGEIEGEVGPGVVGGRNHRREPYVVSTEPLIRERQRERTVWEVCGTTDTGTVEGMDLVRGVRNP